MERCMKKVKSVLAAAALALMLVACGDKQGGTSTFSPSQSSIFVTRDGSFSSSLVEHYEKKEYTQEKLQTFVGEIVSSYNESKGAEAASENSEGAAKLPVAVSSCTLGEGTAIIIFDYGSGADLVDFAAQQQDEANQAKALAYHKTADLLNQGSFDETVFVEAKDGKNAKPEKLKKAGENCVAVEGAVTIQTEGKIQYVSQGVTVQDDFTARTPEGSSYIIFK